MLKKLFKQFLKKNKVVFFLISTIIYSYLTIVYATARWHFIWSNGYNKRRFLAENRTIFAIWHNRLAFGSKIFRGQKNTAALISSHSDGKIISNIVKMFGFKVIEGSTNKNPVGALRSIIRQLSSGGNVVITPDGPRGPIYEINSNITSIARKYNAKLIPISCHVDKYFLLKSWDKLIMPLPFSKITIIVGEPLQLSEDNKQNTHNLQKILMQLGDMKNPVK